MEHPESTGSGGAAPTSDLQHRPGHPCLTSKFSETFYLEDIRVFLGVPTNKLSRFPDLRRYCLQPAVDEVNALSSGNRSPPLRSNCDRNREVMQVRSGAGESVSDV